MVDGQSVFAGLVETHVGPFDPKGLNPVVSLRLHRTHLHALDFVAARIKQLHRKFVRSLVDYHLSQRMERRGAGLEADDEFLCEKSAALISDDSSREDVIDDLGLRSLRYRRL